MSDVSCYRISTLLGREEALLLSSALDELYWPPPDAVGVFAAEGERWRLDAYFPEKPDETAFRQFIAHQGLGDADLSIAFVPDTDWVALAQARLHPVRAGKFLIHGSHDRGTVARNRWTIEIDAARAFGTAHHESTRGCIEMLDVLGKRERFANILDIGTGTGILAILAARQWRARVIATDIDSVATHTARANARANGVGDFIATVTAAGLGHQEIRRRAPYDMVTANILARPLSALAPELSRAVNRAGFVILSGIIHNQAARVAAAYRAAGFTRHREIVIEDWVTLAMRRTILG